MIEVCPKCNTELFIAPGIGPYCPNRHCDVIDDTSNWEQPMKPLYIKKTYYTTVEEQDNELFILIPDEITRQLNWDEGDILMWRDNFDGTYNIGKK